MEAPALIIPARLQENNLKPEREKGCQTQL